MGQVFKVDEVLTLENQRHSQFRMTIVFKSQNVYKHGEFQ